MPNGQRKSGAHSFRLGGFFCRSLAARGCSAKTSDSQRFLMKELRRNKAIMPATIVISMFLLNHATSTATKRQAGDGYQR